MTEDKLRLTKAEALRWECLNLASERCGCGEADEVVATAEAFARFVTSGRRKRPAADKIGLNPVNIGNVVALAGRKSQPTAEG